jgi:hypothetical protein
LSVVNAGAKAGASGHLQGGLFKEQAVRGAKELNLIGIVLASGGSRNVIEFGDGAN